MKADYCTRACGTAQRGACLCAARRRRECRDAMHMCGVRVDARPVTGGRAVEGGGGRARRADEGERGHGRGGRLRDRAWGVCVRGTLVGAAGRCIAAVVARRRRGSGADAGGARRRGKDPAAGASAARAAGPCGGNHAAGREAGGGGSRRTSPLGAGSRGGLRRHAIQRRLFACAGYVCPSPRARVYAGVEKGCVRCGSGLACLFAFTCLCPTTSCTS